MKTLHPKMQAHAAKVKQAHAHLSATVPGFTQLPGKARLQAVQQHIRVSAKRSGY